MTANDGTGAPRLHGRGLVLLVLVAMLAGAVGFAGGWFWRGMSSLADEGVQQGVFTLSVGEEKKIAFPRPYGAKPHLELDESNKFFTVTEVEPGYFRVKAQPGAAVQNQPWKARGVPAP
jgi:hypothetical protein